MINVEFVEDILTEDQDFISELFDNFEYNANIIQDEFKVIVSLNEKGLTIKGDKDYVMAATELIKNLYEDFNRNKKIDGTTD